MSPSRTGAATEDLPPGSLSSGRSDACNGGAHAALPGDWAQGEYTWDASTLLAATLRVPATARFDAGLPLAPALTASCTLKADRKAAKGKCCQVDGCATPLPTPQSAVRGGADAYCFRYRVCAAHLRAPSVRLRGAEAPSAPQRWCQKCSRFEPQTAFEGARRTCAAQLRRSVEARKAAKGGTRTSTPPSSSAPPPPSDTGLVALIDDWGSAQAHAGLDAPPSTGRPSSSDTTSIDAPDAEQVSIAMEAFLKDLLGDVGGSADAAVHALMETPPPPPPLPPPLPRRVEVTVKLHGLTPANLPAGLASAFEAWFESAPLLVEGHVRPGCTLLTVDVLLEAAAADAACAPGAEAALAAHLRSGGVERDAAVKALFAAASPSLALRLRDSAGAPGRAALLAPGGAAPPWAGDAQPVHCRLHGQSLPFSGRPGGGSLRLSPRAPPGLALFTLPVEGATAAAPVLLCAEPRVVAEVNADLRADGGAACELLGYGLRHDATRDVRDAATDAALRRGWLSAAAALLRATQLTQMATPAFAASAWTPLHAACTTGDPRGVALVLRLCPGASVTSRDERGISPLHLAAAHRDARAARLLLASAWPAAPALRAWFSAASHSGETPSTLAVRAGGPASRLDAALRARCAAASLTDSAYRAWVVDTNARLVATFAALQLLRSCPTVGLGSVDLTRLDSVAVLRDPSLAAATVGIQRMRATALSTSTVFDVVTGARVALTDAPWQAAQSLAGAFVATFPLRCSANLALIVATTTPRLRGWVQRHWSLLYLVCAMLESGTSVLAEYIGLYQPHGLAIDYTFIFGVEHICAFLVLSGGLIGGQAAAAGGAGANAVLVIFRLLASASCLPLSRATWAAAAASPHLALQAGVAFAALATLPWIDRRLRRLAAVEGARRRRKVRAKRA